MATPNVTWSGNPLDLTDSEAEQALEQELGLLASGITERLLGGES